MIYLFLAWLPVLMAHPEVQHLSVPSKSNADLVIGGIFPITVEQKVNPNGLQEALALVYAVGKINEERTLLPDCKLGVDIKNSEDSKEIALRETTQFDFVRISNCDSEATTKTIAVIGMRKSAISHTVSTFASAFKVPSVSYGATDIRLNNKQRYPWFLRTIPGDDLLTEVVVKLLERQKWHSLIVVFENTDFGYSGFTNLEKSIENRATFKLCIFTSFIYDKQDFERNMRDFQDELKNFSQAKTVIFFVHKEGARQILEKMLLMNITGYALMFLDGINAKEIQGLDNNLELNTVFSLMPADFEENSRIKGDYYEFASKHFFNRELHKLIPNITNCNVVNETSCFRLSESSLIPYVIDAVELIAHALNRTETCTQNVRNLLSMEVIQNVTFKSALGYDFKFDSKKNVQGRYDIWQLVRQPNNQTGTKFEKVGSWSADVFNDSKVSTDHGISQCNIKCDPGKGHFFEDHQDCCGVCKECQPQDYRDVETDQCKSCDQFFKPNQNKTGCIPINKIARHRSPVWVIIAIFAVCGAILSCVYIAVFFKYNDTHVIRASSWDISIAILIGALFSFCSPFTVMFHVTDVSCKLNLIWSAVSISLMIGALFLKTNRTYRIFSKHVLRRGLPRFLGTNCQFTIVFGIVSLALLTSAIASFDQENPVKYKQQLSSSGDVLYVTCDYGRKAIVGLWIFLSILVLICTYQAVLSRKLPGNYREARNIMFTMLAVSLALCFALPSLLYASYNTDFNPQVCLSFICIVSAAGTLIFLFTPKIYVVIFRPSENQEPLPHSTLGTFEKNEQFPSAVVLRDNNDGETGTRNSGEHPVKRRKLTREQECDLVDASLPKEPTKSTTKIVWRDPVKRHSLKRQLSRNRTSFTGTLGGTITNYDVGTQGSI